MILPFDTFNSKKKMNWLAFGYLILLEIDLFGLTSVGGFKVLLKPVKSIDLHSGTLVRSRHLESPIDFKQSGFSENNEDCLSRFCNLHPFSRKSNRKLRRSKSHWPKNQTSELSPEPVISGHQQLSDDFQRNEDLDGRILLKRNNFSAKIKIRENGNESNFHDGSKKPKILFSERFHQKKLSKPEGTPQKSFSRDAFRNQQGREIVAESSRASSKVHFVEDEAKRPPSEHNFAPDYAKILKGYIKSARYKVFAQPIQVNSKDCKICQGLKHNYTSFLLVEKSPEKRSKNLNRNILNEKNNELRFDFAYPPPSEIQSFSIGKKFKKGSVHDQLSKETETQKVTFHQSPQSESKRKQIINNFQPNNFNGGDKSRDHIRNSVKFEKTIISKEKKNQNLRNPYSKPSKKFSVESINHSTDPTMILRPTLEPLKMNKFDSETSNGNDHQESEKFSGKNELKRPEATEKLGSVLPNVAYINSLTTAHFARDGSGLSHLKEIKSGLKEPFNLTEILNYLRLKKPNRDVFKRLHDGFKDPKASNSTLNYADPLKSDLSQVSLKFLNRSNAELASRPNRISLNFLEISNKAENVALENQTLVNPENKNNSSFIDLREKPKNLSNSGPSELNNSAKQDLNPSSSDESEEKTQNLPKYLSEKKLQKLNGLIHEERETLAEEEQSEKDGQVRLPRENDELIKSRKRRSEPETAESLQTTANESTKFLEKKRPLARLSGLDFLTRYQKKKSKPHEKLVDFWKVSSIKKEVSKPSKSESIERDNRKTTAQSTAKPNEKLSDETVQFANRRKISSAKPYSKETSIEGPKKESQKQFTLNIEAALSRSEHTTVVPKNRYKVQKILASDSLEKVVDSEKTSIQTETTSTESGLKELEKSSEQIIPKRAKSSASEKPPKNIKNETFFRRTPNYNYINRKLKTSSVESADSGKIVDVGKSPKYEIFEDETPPNHSIEEEDAARERKRNDFRERHSQNLNFGDYSTASPYRKKHGNKKSSSGDGNGDFESKTSRYSSINRNRESSTPSYREFENLFVINVGGGTFDSAKVPETEEKKFKNFQNRHSDPDASKVVEIEDFDSSLDWGNGGDQSVLYYVMNEKTKRGRWISYPSRKQITKKHKKKKTSMDSSI